MPNILILLTTLLFVLLIGYKNINLRSCSSNQTPSLNLWKPRNITMVEKRTFSSKICNLKCIFMNPCVCKRFFIKTSSWLCWTPLMEIWRRKNSGDVSILQTRLVVLQVLYVSSCIHYSLLHFKNWVLVTFDLFLLAIGLYSGAKLRINKAPFM